MSNSEFALIIGTIAVFALLMIKFYKKGSKAARNTTQNK